MKTEQRPSLLEHFTRQFAEQASRGGDCAGPLANVAYAGQQVRRIQHEVERAEARAAHAEERSRRAERRVEEAQADVTHWHELATRDWAAMTEINAGADNIEDLLPGANKHLAELEDAYRVCRAGPGGHERGACATESADVAHWRGTIAGYKDSIEVMRKQADAAERRWRRDEHAAVVARKAVTAAQDKANRAAAESDQLAEEAAVLTRELLTAKEALAQAYAALRKCRKNHPAEDCGDRGGPGVRLYGRGEEKKCASWKDVLGTAQ